MWLWGGFGWLRLSRRYFYFLVSAFTSWRLCPAFQGPKFEVRGSKFGVHHKPPEYNSPPAPPSGWSGGTLDKPWTCPGTIEPSQTPVFDQPHLFSSLHPLLRRLRCARADGVLPVAPRRSPLVYPV